MIEATTAHALSVRVLATALLVSLVSLAAVANAEPSCDSDASGEPSARTADADPHPQAGAWSLDLRLPIGVTLSDTGTVIGVTGFEMGVGRRITDRLYLGATGEWGLGINIHTGARDVLRVGGEARYVFHRGAAAASTDDQSWHTVPRYDWIGARAGAETIDGSHGAFGELALGADAWLTPTFQFGMYVAAGLSLEPLGAYGAASPDEVAALWDSERTSTTLAPGSAYIRDPYFTLGWRFAFD